MAEIQNNHVSSISTGGFPLSNLRFTEDIDLIGGTKKELQELTDKRSSNRTF